MQLTKTTTRALAASLAMVAAGGTIAGAAVFHLPILGLGGADVASANAAPTAPAVPVAPKVRPKVIVKTRYADDVVHVPAPAPVAATPPLPAASMQATSSPKPDLDEAKAEPAPMRTVAPPSGTVTEHDDDEYEYEDEHEVEHEVEHEDGPDEPEHAGHAGDDSGEHS